MSAQAAFSTTPRPANPASQRPHILIVDDDIDVLEALECLLRPAFNITLLSEPDRTQEAVAQYRPQLLLLDFRMPRLNGADLCRAIRVIPDYDTMPVVIFSAYDMHDIRMSCYEAGADDFIAKPFDRDEIRAKLQVWVRLAQRSAHLLRCNRQLAEEAYFDDLTGLLTRRRGLEFLRRELERQRRYATPLALVLLDIDDFKSINDRYGHACGDRVLQALAQRMRAELRANDIAIRYGGDEFIVAIPHGTREVARRVFEKLQDGDLSVRLDDGARLHFYLTGGAASVCGEALEPDDLIQRADLAMLTAKKTGKASFRHCPDNGARPDDIAQLHQQHLTVRDSLCQLLSTALREVERKGDVLGNRRQRMQIVGERISEHLHLTAAQRRTLNNAIRLTNCEKSGLAMEASTRRGGLPPELRDSLEQVMRTNLDLMERTRFLAEEARALRHMHEWYDGSGFPDGLAGEAIPLLSRLLGLLGAYAILRDGGHRTPAHGEQDTWALLRRERGTHFDPMLLDALQAVTADYASMRETPTTRQRILLLDDDPEFVRILSRHIRQAGHKLTVTTSCQEAAQRMSEELFDIALIDLILPDGDGLDLCASRLATPSAPLTVILSCRFDEQAINRARELGAIAYIVKPVSLELLLNTLASLNAQAGEPPPFLIMRH